MNYPSSSSRSGHVTPPILQTANTQAAQQNQTNILNQLAAANSNNLALSPNR